MNDVLTEALALAPVAVALRAPAVVPVAALVTRPVRCVALTSTTAAAAPTFTFFALLA